MTKHRKKSHTDTSTYYGPPYLQLSTHTASVVEWVARLRTNQDIIDCLANGSTYGEVCGSDFIATPDALLATDGAACAALEKYIND